MNATIPTCYLHIGMPKTGTSSIQESIGSTDELGNWGKYCKITTANNQTGAFCTMFLSKPEKFHANVKRGLSKEEISETRNNYRTNFKKILQENKYNNLLISAEGLFHVDENGLNDLFKFIKTYYRNIVVICYIRPPTSYISSSFQQTLKSRNIQNMDLEREYPFYRKKLEKFENVFGRNSIIYSTFDKKTLQNGDVVQDFCGKIGINYSLINKKRTNESLSFEASAILFTYRKNGGLFGIGKDTMLKNRLMVEKLGELHGKKLTFCSSLILPIIEKHRDDIKWMQDRLEHSLLPENSTREDHECIRHEEDLLNIPPAAITWLQQETNVNSIPTASPQQITVWLQELQLKLLNTHKATQRLHKPGRKT